MVFWSSESRLHAESASRAAPPSSGVAGRGVVTMPPEGGRVRGRGGEGRGGEGRGGRGGGEGGRRVM